MIDKIKIRNFKSLSDTGSLTVRPLTFLLGPNSSGKTSLLQSLLLLRQTVDSRDIKNPLAINGNYVSLGSYREMIFGHNYHNNLSIDISWMPQPYYSDRLSFAIDRLHRTDGMNRHRYQKATHVLQCEFGYNKKAMTIHVTSLCYSAVPLSNSSPNQVKMEVKRDKTGKYSATVSTNGKVETASEGTLNKFDSFIPSIRKAPDRRAYPAMDMIARTFSSSLEELFSKVFYIGPIREPPKRLYVASGQAPQDVGLRGELSVDVLWVSNRRKKERERLMGYVTHWMKMFDIAERVELKRLGGNNYWLNLLDPHLNLPVNLADVGFGASQVLPIIVEGFYAPFGSTLLVEQPEIHLHPRAQAVLGDLFGNIAREGGVKRLLIETHSEHLINRIQRRIAEGKIKKDDVIIYYFDPSPKGTQITEIALDNNGAFIEDGLPQGFFQETFLDSKARLEATFSKPGGDTSNGPEN